MPTLTPTQDSTVYTLAAQMMAACPRGAAGDADRARIDKALDLVATVERLPLPGLFEVASGSKPNWTYLVVDGLCGCPDAQRRDARRCKHSRAVALFQQIERAEVDAEQDDAPKTTHFGDSEAACICGHAFYSHFPNGCAHCKCREMIYDCRPPVTIRVDTEDSILDLWPGEPCALPAQCSRCHAEAAILTHADRLGRTCLVAELFGAEG